VFEGGIFSYVLGRNDDTIRSGNFSF
jgi:hypothetical protein